MAAILVEVCRFALGDLEPVAGITEALERR